MALNTFTGLSDAVYRRLNRTADAAVFADCLVLAEAEINRRLALKPVRPMHIVATATLAGEFIGDPSLIIDVDSLTIGTDPVLSTSPQNMAAMYEQDSEAGQPKFYALVGGQIRLYPTPDAAYTAKLIYWSKVPALGGVAPSNWLTESHPDVYFHGVLAHAYQEYFDEEAAQIQAGLFDVALQKVLDAYPARTDKRLLRVDPMFSCNRMNGALA